MERRKKIWAIAAAIGCLSFCGTAAGNGIPNFILATALTSDEISAARKALAIKEDAIKTVKADYLPTLTADVSGSWVREGKKTSALVDRFADVTNPHTYTLTVDQNLWNGGQTTLSEEIALLDYKSEEGNPRSVSKNLIYENSKTDLMVDLNQDIENTNDKCQLITDA